jgi:farnesyl-diphosphate farnesyltransferase
MTDLLLDPLFSAAGVDIEKHTCAKPWTYAEAMLQKVSRTFALNIQVLPTRIKRTILLAYLFCRIADTIEDDAELSTPSKQLLLSKFDEIFRNPHSWENKELEFRKLLPSTWQQGPGFDQLLSYQSAWVFSLYYNLPATDIAVVRKWVLEMSKGMSEYCQRRDLNDKWFILKDMEDLDQYCYYVAGTVGFMLCDLFMNHSVWITPAKHKKMSELANSFGLGLQVTNIAKDILEDWHRKTSFVPISLYNEQQIQFRDLPNSSPEQMRQVLDTLISKALDHLQDALNYTLLLPRLEPKMRLFCIWPLFLALATLEKLAHCEPLAAHRVKITRDEVQQILKESSYKVFSNRKLQQYFQHWQARIQSK